MVQLDMLIASTMANSTTKSLIAVVNQRNFLGQDSECHWPTMAMVMTAVLCSLSMKSSAALLSKGGNEYKSG